MYTNPLVSIFTSCRNSAHYIKETLDSIFQQDYDNYEVCIVDGASVDNTCGILEDYQKSNNRLRWYSEPDNNMVEGFKKALAMTRGKYVMLLPISDVYVKKNWFKTCVEIMENDDEISLVHGVPQTIMGDGKILSINRMHQDAFKYGIPNKKNFLSFWFATYYMFSELTYCVRTHIFKDLFLKADSENCTDMDNPFLMFCAYFMREGYLPFFVKEVVSYGRVHEDSLDLISKKRIASSDNKYYEYADRYYQNVLEEKAEHVYRNGRGEIIGTILPERIKNLKKYVNYYRRMRNIRKGNFFPNMNYLISLFETWYGKLNQFLIK